MYSSILKRDFSPAIIRELLYFYLYGLKGVLFITIPILFISRGSEFAGHFYYMSLYAIGYLIASSCIIAYGSYRKGRGLHFDFAPCFSMISAIPLFVLATSNNNFNLIVSVFAVGFIFPFISPIKSAKINYLTNEHKANQTRVATTKYFLQNLANLTSLIVLFIFNQKVMLVMLACVLFISGASDILTRTRIKDFSDINSEAKNKDNRNYKNLMILILILGLVCFVYDQTFQAFEVKIINTDYIHNLSEMWFLNIGTIIACYFISYKVSFATKMTPYYLAASVVLMSLMLMLGNYTEHHKALLVILISIGEYFMFAILDRFVILFSKGSTGYASFISSLTDLILYSSAAFLGIIEFLFHTKLNVSHILDLCLIIGVIAAIIIVSFFNKSGAKENEC